MIPTNKAIIIMNIITPITMAPVLVPVELPEVLNISDEFELGGVNGSVGRNKIQTMNAIIMIKIMIPIKIHQPQPDEVFTTWVGGVFTTWVGTVLCTTV